MLRGGGHITEGEGEFGQDRPSHSIDGILGELHFNGDGDDGGAILIWRWMVDQGAIIMSSPLSKAWHWWHPQICAGC